MTNANININQVLNPVTKEPEVEIIINLRVNIDNLGDNVSTFALDLAKQIKNVMTTVDSSTGAA